MNLQTLQPLAVMGRDVPWLINQWVERTPDKPFIIWAPKQGPHRHYSYADFDRHIRQFAGGLQQAGLQPGQRLLIHMDNSPEYLMAYFACAYIGAVAVLINNRSAAQELKHFIQLTEVAGAITQPQYQPAVQTAMAAYSPKAFVISVDSTDADTYVDTSANKNTDKNTDTSNDTSTDYQALLSAEPYQGLRPHDPMLDLRVQFTSGTTARPKAVLTTHANSLYAAQHTAQAYGLTSNDIAQLFVPLFHTNGLSVVVMSTLWAGGSIVMQPKFSASQFWPIAREYRCTWASMPGPFFLRAIYQQPVPEHDFRFWYAAVLPEVEAHFKLKTRGHWGMTEMVTLPIVGDSHHNGARLSIGRPGNGNQIAIRRPDGSPCQPGETGRLYVRGTRGITLFKEYLNNPEATAAAFDQQGWFDTGDEIRIDSQGDLFFAGRAKDHLRVGGENVAASEIEAVIQSLPWVKECAVVGRQHPMLDEVPVAFISVEPQAPEEAEAEVIAHCQQHLADFKVVRAVNIVEEFPRAGLDKIAKHKLQA